MRDQENCGRSSLSSPSCAAGQRAAREGRRQYDVVDRLLSMHATLRDRYERRALCLNTSLVGVSLFLSIFAFVSDDVLRALGYEAAMARLVVGVAAIGVLLLSITEFRVDWRTSASQHDEAAERLAKLKAKYRRVIGGYEGGNGADYSGLAIEYERTMVGLRPIPERLFTRLKARHEFKKACSRRLDDHPGAPGWLVGVQLRVEAMWGVLRGSGNEVREG